MSVDKVRESILELAKIPKNQMHVVNALLEEITKQLGYVEQGILELDHYAEEWFSGDGDEPKETGKSPPRVSVEWAESDGICSSNDYEIFAPKGYVLEVQMDHCGCRPYHVKLVEEKPCADCRYFGTIECTHCEDKQSFQRRTKVETSNSRSKGEKDKGAIPETAPKSKGTLGGDEPYGDSPRAHFSGSE